MREAQVTSRLRHPGIVAVIDFNTLPNGSAFLVMEYLEGESLGKVLARTGPMPLARVADLTEQMGSALSAAHAQGVVHRDVHPQNVFVLPPSGGDGERIKILDFGLSKVASVPQRITGTAAVMGTPLYMSPEQCRGTKEVDHRTDIYALGVLMFQMMTGTLPFDGESMGEVLVKQVTMLPPAPRGLNPSIPPSVEQVLLRCLAKPVDARFATMMLPLSSRSKIASMMSPTFFQAQNSNNTSDPPRHAFVINLRSILRPVDIVLPELSAGELARLLRRSDNCR